MRCRGWFWQLDVWGGIAAGDTEGGCARPRHPGLILLASADQGVETLPPPHSRSKAPASPATGSAFGIATVATARTAAAAALQSELNTVLAGVLLESQLALRDANPAQTPRLRHLVQLAGDLRDRLRT